MVNYSIIFTLYASKKNRHVFNHTHCFRRPQVYGQGPVCKGLESQCISLSPRF